MSDISGARPPRNLIFVCDGTLSSITAGEETNAGQLYRLLSERGQDARQRYEYDRGVQGTGWRRWLNAASGLGVNLSICRGYAFLATHYRPGDRIFLFGYSRGAYAVRSLAGMIGGIGLLRRNYATARHVNLAFRFYEIDSQSNARREFTKRRCYAQVPIEMLGVWDTVKSLGLPYPLINRLAPMATEFHDHQLADHIAHGYHALAIDEDRQSFRPILWRQSPHWEGRLEQVWFPGAHADVGGDVRALGAARPLGNVSFNWMLRRAARHGIMLPDDWDQRYPEDPCAPLIGSRRGVGRFFILRENRRLGGADGETLHLSVRERMQGVPRYRPRTELGAANENSAATARQSLRITRT